MTQVTSSRVSGGDTSRAWNSANFRWIWAGAGFSLLGSETGEIAIPLLALITLEAGPAEMSVLRAAQFMPFLVLTLWVGVLVDRMRRRRLMIGADLGRGLLLLAIPVLLLAGSLPIALLAVIIFLAGSLTVLYQIADFSFLPSVVSRDQLADANAKITATQSTMSVAGGGIGGAAVQLVTAPLAVAGSSIAHMLSALSLSRTHVDEQAPARHGTSFWAEAREGLRHLVGNRAVRALAGEAASWNLFNEIYMLGVTIYIVADLGLGPAVLGMIFVAGGIGSFLGAWFSGWATQNFGYGRSLTATLLLGNTAPIGIALCRDSSAFSVAICCAVFFVSGLGIGVANAQAVTVRQLATPVALRGRVNSAYRLLTWGILPLGALAAGVVGGAWGPYTAAVAGAAGMSLATLWVLFSPIRGLRDLTDATKIG